MVEYDLLDSLSVIEIGTMFSTMLFGITIVQTYLYFTRFPDDPTRLKAFVFVIFLLETGHVAAVLHAFYTLSIILYNRPDLVFAKSPAGIAIATLLSGYIACVVQIYFANRLRKFSSWFYNPDWGRLLVYFCWFLSLLRGIATTAITVVMFIASLTEFTTSWNWLVSTSLVIGAVVDIIVAAGLCYNLFRQRKVSFVRTTKLIDRILIMTIQTGVTTSVLTLAVTVCFLIITDSFAWVAIYLCLARVFSNSLLASLNSRTNLRKINQEPISFKLSTNNQKTSFPTQAESENLVASGWDTTSVAIKTRRNSDTNTGTKEADKV